MDMAQTLSGLYLVKGQASGLELELDHQATRFSTLTLPQRSVLASALETRAPIARIVAQDRPPPSTDRSGREWPESARRGLHRCGLLPRYPFDEGSREPWVESISLLPGREDSLHGGTDICHSVDGANRTGVSPGSRSSIRRNCFANLELETLGNCLVHRPHHFVSGPPGRRSQIRSCPAHQRNSRGPDIRVHAHQCNPVARSDCARDEQMSSCLVGHDHLQRRLAAHVHCK